ncbi:MAG: hypothetical protein WC975_15975 [Phycisphaerae bacterium]
MTEKVFKKITQIIFLLAGSVFLTFTLSGCGSQSVGLNPFALLSQINSVDHTPFFNSAYNTFITQEQWEQQWQDQIQTDLLQTSQATSSLPSSGQ